MIVWSEILILKILNIHEHIKDILLLNYYQTDIIGISQLYIYVKFS